jgi:hypothetical protein
VTNVPDKGSRENRNLYFMRQYGKNIAVTGRPQMKIWRMRIAGWIPKATSTHTEFTKNQNQQEVK